MPIILIIILVVLAVIGIFLWMTYNKLVKANIRVEEAWSDITVQLKRRADLIPNLVNTVQGYAKHEKQVFQDVTEARSNVLKGAEQGPKAAANAENQLEDALKSIFAVSEDYPDLKASQNFQELQDELTDTEDKIQAARRMYNSAVRNLNTAIQTFPNNVLNSMLHFKEHEFFELEDREAISEPVEVKF